MKLGMICSTKTSPHAIESFLPFQIGGLLAEGFQGVVGGSQLGLRRKMTVMLMGTDLGGEGVSVTLEQGEARQGKEDRAGGRATHRAGDT